MTNGIAPEQQESSNGINPFVFYPASIFIFLILIFLIISPDTAKNAFSLVQSTIITNGGWFYILTVAVILITVIYLGFSRFGTITLGLDHATPEFSRLSWFAMLFSAGMGIGLMFYGVAEPVMHFLKPPLGGGGDIEAAREAMKITFFHWGLHAWAVYAIVALILAFFSYRHGLPLTMRSALYPLIGDKIYGPIGHAVDVFAIVGTLFGVATSLGFGVAQVNSGLHHLIPSIPVNETVQVALIFAITCIAAISVVSGLDKGIKFLSELNLSLAVVLLIFVLFAGATVFLLQALVQNVGHYLSNVVSITFNLYAYDKTDWIGGWTIFYWGWWISWSPFVGLFIARVSRGRTIREFVSGVLLIPVGFTFVWMTVFGNTGIDQILNGGNEALANMVSKDVSVALFGFLESFPFSGMTSILAIVMVIVFFVTSSDSGSMVIDMLSTNGNDKSPIWVKLYWAFGEGLVAVILIYAGGLGALQTMTIASALPFSIILLIGMYGLIKALKVDLEKQNALLFTPSIPSSGDHSSWRERLQSMTKFPNQENVLGFIHSKVISACNEVQNELKKSGTHVEVQRTDDGVELLVSLGSEIDFMYQVIAQPIALPDYVEGKEASKNPDGVYFRAEVHLKEGGQDYDLMHWSKEGIINDIIDQYHKHLHFLNQLRQPY